MRNRELFEMGVEQTDTSHARARSFVILEIGAEFHLAVRRALTDT